ncbi:hypothetical protein [Glycomyces tarimensis]
MSDAHSSGGLSSGTSTAAAVRKPSPVPYPQPVEPSPSPPFQPWRVDFSHPEVVEYPVAGPPEASEPSTVAKRLLLLLGLAYLFLAALASGLAYTGYFTATESDGAADDRDDRPNQLPPCPRPPVRDPHAPGLHTRPDGSRYLVMPLPADPPDRYRATASAAPAMSGGGVL